MSSSYVIPGLGPEKSQHLWELIKAKLASLNLYSDDVLSEYIMVLLHGGSSKEKIYEELVIFMNSPEVAEHFVVWLCEEVDRLLFVSNKERMGLNVVAVPSKPDEIQAHMPQIQVQYNDDRAQEQAQPRPKQQQDHCDDVNMNNGNRVHSTRNFTKALESVKSNVSVSSGTRRTFSTEPSRQNEYESRNRDRDNRDYIRRNPSLDNRRIVRNTTAEDGGRVQKVKLSVDFDRDEQNRDGGRQKRTFSFKKVQVKAEGVDGDGESAVDPQAPQKVIRVKCQYWPNCRAGETCPNIHPSETCKHFPNCQFGDDCTFLHPSIPCKFQEKCQNPLCNYQHRPAFAGNNVNNNNISIGSSTITCKFYPHCVNATCPYMHPVKVQCRYGMECSRPDCPFEHPTGRKGAHLKSAVFSPCKYGKQCARADCPYRHEETSPNVPELLSSIPPPIITEDQNMMQ